jgi:hypothetical protein
VAQPVETCINTAPVAALGASSLPGFLLPSFPRRFGSLLNLTNAPEKRPLNSLTVAHFSFFSHFLRLVFPVFSAASYPRRTRGRAI